MEIKIQLKKIWAAMSQNNYAILALIIAVFILGGAVLAKQSEQTRLEGMDSSASQVFPYHWPHGMVPFQMTVKNEANGIYLSAIQNAFNRWSNSHDMNSAIFFAGINTPNQIPADCPTELGIYKICSVTDGTGSSWLAQTEWNFDSSNRITYAKTTFNDGMMANGMSEYGTSAYRNYILCNNVGNVLRLEFTDTNLKPFDTCMKPTNLKRVADQQNPNATDIRTLRDFYLNNIDAPPTPTPSSPPSNVFAELKCSNSAYDNYQDDECTVNFGDKAYLKWVSDGQGCNLTGPGINQAVGPVDSMQTPAINFIADYRIECMFANMSGEDTVRIYPHMAPPTPTDGDTYPTPFPPTPTLTPTPRGTKSSAVKSAVIGNTSFGNLIASSPDSSKQLYVQQLGGGETKYTLVTYPPSK